MQDNNKNRSFWSSLKDKGYYIALILCAAAVGVSGYLYYRSNSRNIPKSNLSVSTTTPTAPNRAVGPTGGVLEAAGTEPTLPGTLPTLPKPEETTPVKLETMLPVTGETAAEYSVDALAYNTTTRDWRTHHGIDLAAAAGTDVVAAADGTVYTVYEDEALGTTVILRHDGGYITRYSSLAVDVAVKAGDTVTRGQTLGQVGSTALVETALGPHLHFAVTCGGVSVDPAEFLP